MFFKCHIMFFCLILFFFSCTNYRGSAHETIKDQALKHESKYVFCQDNMDKVFVNNPTIINLKDFDIFQTFDEYEMKGIGLPKKTPYVYVKNCGDKIYLVVSNDTTNVKVYQKNGEYWCNYEYYSNNTRITKSSQDLPERFFCRICGSDTIVEYRCCNLGICTYKDLYLKTKYNCYWIHLIEDIDLCNNSKIFEDMLGLVKRFKEERPLFLSEIGESSFDKRHLYSYTLFETKDYFKYIGIDNNEELFFLKTSLGFFGIQPGFDFFDIDKSTVK